MTRLAALIGIAFWTGDIAVRDGAEAVRMVTVLAVAAGAVAGLAGDWPGDWLAAVIRELRRQRRFGFVWPTVVGA